MTTLENPLNLQSTPITGNDENVRSTATEKSTQGMLMPEHASLYAHCHKRYIEVEELLEFAVEQGKLEPLSLAMDVKNLKQILYYTPDAELSGEQLCQTEGRLEVLYAKVAHLVAPVTIETLRATSDKYAVHRQWWTSWLLGSFSVGRNFLRQLFWVGMLFLIVMFAGRYFNLHFSGDETTRYFTNFGTPFLYGAIGAWIYLYRTLTNSYSQRCLNPQEWPTYWLRLFMGAFAGGLFVHFMLPEMESVRVDASHAVSDNVIAKTALGLLAGYSVDFFYGTLDRLLQAILPPNQLDNQTVSPSVKQQETEALLKRLQEANNEQDKAAIRALLEKL